jgi:1-aminocyclopropane-1-carboxylate deaminase/D-cysteine desulfhydrase-like pyridoxal-dependent ACC family enzyme
VILPLHERFAGTKSLAHVTLGCFPTPVESVPELARLLGLQFFFVKRDDISGCAYGGNKVRKLEFLLGQALAERRRAVITFGAVGSNHVRATAVYGGQLGLQVHAVLAPQPSTPYLEANLLADRKAGAHLHFVDSMSQALRRGTELRDEITLRDGVEPFVIPFGGTNARGTIGFVNAAIELHGQIETGALPEPDFVYLPYGSTGTASGLAIGLAAVGLRTCVVGVRVVPAEATNPARTRRVMEEAVSLLRELDSGFPLVKPESVALEVRDGFLGDGYAAATAESLAAVALAEANHIHIETTYTGKALAALVADARAGKLVGQTALFWNTYNSR